MIKHILTSVIALAATTMLLAQQSNTPVYLNLNAPLEDRVEDALSRMTLDEKIAVIHAQSKFSSPGVKRLGIPELWTSDGPHGIRPEVLWDRWVQAGWSNDSCVAYPALSCLAATWNEDMASLYGHSIGEEARFREKDVLLGPGVNIYRTPLNGRNFEYMGEDPFLAAKMVVPYIQGVQSNGVAACVKHYCLNNEETHRHTTDVDLSERALQEIYLPAFRAAVVEGHVWSIMGSYNLFRGRYVCQNPYLLKTILRDQWGFDGAVITDWGALHQTEQATDSGIDLEFGTGTNGLTTNTIKGYDAYHLAARYKEGILSGKYSEEELNEKVRRVLRLNFRTAMAAKTTFGSMCSDEHYAAARKIGGEGIVLLKNQKSTLPVVLGPKTKKIVVVGENAIKMMTVGGGSSSLKAQREILPIEGIRERVGDDAEIVYCRGYVGDTNNEYNNVKGKGDLSESRSFEELRDEAVKAAKDADYVLFVGGLNKSATQDAEGKDRLAMDLPYRQDELIEALAAANKRFAVVLVSGNAVAMPWIAKVPAVLQAWYIGSEAGHAIADVLFGDVNPSGKLPFTFPAKLTDSPAHQPGMTFPNPGKTFYDEGIYVGYRWFDRKGIKPLFAFGHGLSYTSFKYGKPVADFATISEGGEISITVPVTNSGKVDGAEVVQLYISDPECSVERPAKELKAFRKVFIKAGETVDVVLTVKADDLRFYDDRKDAKGEFIGWTLEPGEFEALIGSASDDIRGRIKFSCK